MFWFGHNLRCSHKQDFQRMWLSGISDNLMFPCPSPRGEPLPPFFPPFFPLPCPPFSSQSYSWFSMGRAEQVCKPAPTSVGFYSKDREKWRTSMGLGFPHGRCSSSLILAPQRFSFISLSASSYFHKLSYVVRSVDKARLIISVLAPWPTFGPK